MNLPPAGRIYQERFARLAERLDSDVRLMEVCGSHSVAIARANLRSLLPQKVRLISGPGCPVCVSGARFIDRILALGKLENAPRIALFGDLLKIPGSDGTTLQNALRSPLVIYSPDEALTYALEHPGENVVLAAVGFEPTLSAVAGMLEQMQQRQSLKNFFLLQDFKRIQGALALLEADRSSRLDGFLLPGHVGAVVGEAGFQELRLPGVISGFEPENILDSLLLLLDAVIKVRAGAPRTIANLYPQVVSPAGSLGALQEIQKFFAPCNSIWRGLGEVAQGGWQLKAEYAKWNAEHQFHLELPPGAAVANGCRCGEVLKGAIEPMECPLFGKVCNPQHPVGACMVSVEGACHAIYQYGSVERF